MPLTRLARSVPSFSVIHADQGPPGRSETANHVPLYFLVDNILGLSVLALPVDVVGDISFILDVFEVLQWRLYSISETLLEYFIDARVVTIIFWPKPSIIGYNVGVPSRAITLIVESASILLWRE